MKVPDLQPSEQNQCVTVFSHVCEILARDISTLPTFSTMKNYKRIEDMSAINTTHCQYQHSNFERGY